MERPEESYNYPVTPDGYLARARARICDNTAESLFYAAFELRSFVEAQQDLYLWAQKEYAKSIPKRWKIGNQGKALLKIFQTENIQHIKWLTGEAIALDLFHVPVSSVLRKRAEQLERRIFNCTHSPPL